MKNFHKKFQLVFLGKTFGSVLMVTKVTKVLVTFGWGVTFLPYELALGGKQDCFNTKFCGHHSTLKMGSYMKKPKRV